MDAAGLRALQAPIKERYKSDPKAGFITLKAKGTLDDTNIACKVETGRALAVAGLHPATGGSGLELCSGDMLLEALVACAGVTLKAVATAIDIPLKSGTVSAEGDLDFRGTLGVAKDAPVGFAQIRLRFDVDTDAPQDKLDQLLKLTERYCVVYQTIRSGPPVEISLQTEMSAYPPSSPVECAGLSSGGSIAIAHSDLRCRDYWMRACAAMTRSRTSEYAMSPACFCSGRPRPEDGADGGHRRHHLGRGRAHRVRSSAR